MAIALAWREGSVCSQQLGVPDASGFALDLVLRTLHLRYTWFFAGARTSTFGK